jgi:hypothetical protein
MKTLIIFFVMLLISGNVSAEINALSSAKGIEKFIPGHPREINNKAEFLPASQGIIKTKDGMFINIPKNKSGAGFRYIGLGPIKLIPGSKYILSCGLQTKYFHNLLILGTFFKSGDLKHGKFVDLNNIASSAFVKMEKEFIVPPDTNRMILWLGVQPAKGRKLILGPVVFIKDLKITRQAPLVAQAELESVYGKNLLQVEDFKDFSPGKVDFDSMQLVNRIKKPYKASIIETEKGIKALAVRYRKGYYPYVHFLGKKFEAFGNVLRFSCRIRGEGKISLSIWWHRKMIGTYYQHSKRITLNKQWQDISIVYACDEPLTDSAVASITCRDDKLDFEVSKVKLSILKP